MSFETLKDQLVPGAMVVTRKDRVSRLHVMWNPDVDHIFTVVQDAHTVDLAPRTVCTLIGNSKQRPHDWFYVMADGTPGWLSYWDIAHVEHISRSG